MIPETRERAERLAWHDYDAGEDAYEDTHCGGYTDVTKAFDECVQVLEKYLRQEASYDTLSNEHVAESFEKRLTYMAQDWSRKHDKGLDDKYCREAAQKAICTYLDNWENKVSGEDDRGHRLGKSW